jgi:hypothetical protein
MYKKVQSLFCFVAVFVTEVFIHSTVVYCRNVNLKQAATECNINTSTVYDRVMKMNMHTHTLT